METGKQHQAMRHFYKTEFDSTVSETVNVGGAFGGIVFTPGHHIEISPLDDELM